MGVLAFDFCLAGVAGLGAIPGIALAVVVAITDFSGMGGSLTRRVRKG